MRQPVYDNVISHSSSSPSFPSSSSSSTHRLFVLSLCRLLTRLLTSTSPCRLLHLLLVDVRSHDFLHHIRFLLYSLLRPACDPFSLPLSFIYFLSPSASSLDYPVQSFFSFTSSPLLQTFFCFILHLCISLPPSYIALRSHLQPRSAALKLSDGRAHKVGCKRSLHWLIDVTLTDGSQPVQFISCNLSFPFILTSLCSHSALSHIFFMTVVAIDRVCCVKYLIGGSRFL